MVTSEDNERLDELEQEIDAARTQAEDHGTIAEREGRNVEYEPGDPVGMPDPEPESEPDARR